MDILMASSEIVPFAKTGGLADVVGALPFAFKKLKCKVKAFMPYYLTVEKSNLSVEPVFEGIPIKLGNEKYVGDILRHEAAPGVEFYFIRQQQFFSREQLYGTPAGDYPDNDKRFIFFCKIILRFCELAGYEPDIVHCHDWQTGLVPVYFKYFQALEGKFKKTATIFTIHNIAYQGLFEYPGFQLTGLPETVYSVAGLEYWGKMNMLKAGINFSDFVTTVSPKYSQEIQTEEYGCGMHGILRDRAEHIVGILNGVDYSVWNPKTDLLIKTNYSLKTIAQKNECKIDLLKEYQLSLKLKDKPLIGLIGRLTDQKGYDLIAEVIDQILERDLTMVILGSGEQKYHDLFNELAQKYPKQFGVRIAYDNKLAHKIEAGSDIFLMPSKFEPCGLTQIYSLKYGTIPIVRATGGLDDTIINYQPAQPDSNGFKFIEYSSQELLTTIDTALENFNNPKVWKQLVRNAMKADFSWDQSAKAYLDLFNRAQNDKAMNLFARFL